MGWDEAWRGVIDQSSSEIAGSLRNVLQDGLRRHPPAPQHRVRPSSAGRGPAHPRPPGRRARGGGTGPRRQGRGSNGQHPPAMAEAPERGPSDRTGRPTGAPPPGGCPDCRGVGLEAAITEGARNSAAASEVEPRMRGSEPPAHASPVPLRHGVAARPPPPSGSEYAGMSSRNGAQSPWFHALGFPRAATPRGVNRCLTPAGGTDRPVAAPRPGHRPPEAARRGSTAGPTVPATDTGGQAEQARTKGAPSGRNSANYPRPLGRRGVRPWPDGTRTGTATVYQKHRTWPTHPRRYQVRGLSSAGRCDR